MPTYRRAALIYNPTSGQGRHRRLQQLEKAAKALEAAGVATTLVPTQAAGSAGRQALEAIAQGHDVIFACGGDGTIHDVLQGMVSGAPEVPLGIVPLGTGNVLANDLGIPWEPARAIAAQLSFAPRRIAVGQIEYRSRTGSRESRYFTVMAGIGADALMIYRSSGAATKKHFGLLTYFWEMLRIAAFHPYEEFQVNVITASSSEPRSLAVAQIAAVRITHFGNFMQRFAPDAALTRDDFQSILISTPSRLKGMAYMIGAILHRRWNIPGIERVHCTGLDCSVRDGQSSVPGIYAQADGEFLGTLPVTIRIVPNAFTLLTPPSR